MADPIRAVTDPTLAASLIERLRHTEPLNEEDFAHLFQNALTSKASADKVDMFLKSNNVSSQERDAFYAYVNRQAKPDLAQRLDTSMATIGSVSVTPEEALMVGQGANAAMRYGPTLARGVAGAMTGAAPLVKYEAAKYGLTKLGVPSSLATVIAMGLSGYSRRGPRLVPAQEEALPRPAAASAAAPASIPAAPSGSLNDALAARSTTATPATPLPARPPIQPENLPEAWRQFAGPPSAEPVAPVTATTVNQVLSRASSAKMKLTATEVVEGARLVQQGKTPAEALDLIQQMRQLNPASDAEVTATVEAQNARTTRAKGGTKD